MIENLINLRPMVYNKMKSLSVLLSLILIVTNCQDKPKPTSIVLETKTNIEIDTKLQKSKLLKDTLNITTVPSHRPGRSA